MGTMDEMVTAAQQARVAELEARLARYRRAYYNPDASDLSLADQVSDDVYDACRDELAELKADSPEAVAVGATPETTSPWVKVAHEIPMGSLNKVNTLEQMTEWILTHSPKDERGQPFPGMELLVTEKLDGMSIHVEYEKGRFKRAVTRGDGVTGEDITRNVAKMKGVPTKLDEKFTGALRGEVIITKSDHAAHFPHYANTRNGASGTAKRLDGKGCEHLTVMFYFVAEGKDFETEGEQFGWLQSLGLQVPNWSISAMVPGIRTPHDIWVEYQQTKRMALDYDIDGLVVRVNNLAHQVSLGFEGANPVGSVAFKFAAITRETTLRKIENQVGSMGHITPVAIFDVVNLLGTQVTNASLYNWKYIRELGLDIGSRVLIARANDVIPRVVSAVQGTGAVAQHPVQCPRCNALTEFQGEHLVCPNTAGCPAQTAGRLIRFVKCHDLLGWGDGLIERLVETGLVKSIPDLYRLDAEQLGAIERMGAKSAAKVIKTLWAKTEFAIEDLLGSLSVPLCGKDTFQLLTDAGIDTIEKMRGATREQFAAIRGLGPVKGKVLHEWFANGSAVVDELRGLGIKVKARRGGSLAGMLFCFTGASKMPRPRLVEIAEAAGATVKGSVTKNLTYLVMADPNSGTTKARAAKKNGTTCISEEEFLAMAGYDAAADTGEAPKKMSDAAHDDGDASLVDEV